MENLKLCDHWNIIWNKFCPSYNIFILISACYEVTFMNVAHAYAHYEPNCDGRILSSGKMNALKEQWLKFRGI